MTLPTDTQKLKLTGEEMSAKVNLHSLKEKTLYSNMQIPTHGIKFHENFNLT